MKKQSGFTIIEILLAVATVAIIGFSGYYVWHRHQTNAQPAAKTTATTKSTASKTTVTLANNINFELPAAWVIGQQLDTGLPGVTVCNTNTCAGYVSFLSLSE